MWQARRPLHSQASADSSPLSAAADSGSPPAAANRKHYAVPAPSERSATSSKVLCCSCASRARSSTAPSRAPSSVHASRAPSSVHAYRTPSSVRASKAPSSARSSRAPPSARSVYTPAGSSPYSPQEIILGNSSRAPAREAGVGAGAAASEAVKPCPPESPALPWPPELPAPPWTPSLLPAMAAWALCSAEGPGRVPGATLEAFRPQTLPLEASRVPLPIGCCNTMSTWRHTQRIQQKHRH